MNILCLTLKNFAMKKLFLVLLAGEIMFTGCKKEEKEIAKVNQPMKKLEIVNPDFVLVNENYISDGYIGELYVNNNNIGDTLFVIKKMIDNKKSETTWEGTFGVTVIPVEANQNQIIFTCDGEPSTCSGSVAYDSEGNVMGCRINILN